MKKIFFIVIYYIFSASFTYAETLTGTILDKRNYPVGGMEVRLFNPSPEIGVSRPIYTNSNGVFFFDDVPYVSGYYDLECYWKGKLVYRGSIKVRGNESLPPINL